MNRMVGLALVALLAALQWRLWVATGGVADTHRLKAQVTAHAESNEALRARNQSLDAEVRDLKSGSAAIEARARNMLGMVRPGETFYLVVDGN